jgi:hypothetical protein
MAQVFMLILLFTFIVSNYAMDGPIHLPSLIAPRLFFFKSVSDSYIEFDNNPLLCNFDLENKGKGI